MEFTFNVNINRGGQDRNSGGQHHQIMQLNTVNAEHISYVPNYLFWLIDFISC